MRWVRRMPNSAKLQVVWLVAAFLLVWASGPVGAEGGSSEGLPATALAQSASAPLFEESAAVGADVGSDVRADLRPDVTVDLSPGASALENGVRLSVLEVVQEPLSTEGAPVGDRLVSVRVALENLGASSITYAALDLGVEAADGSLHARLDARRGPGSMITYGVLEPGGSVVGWRVFVVSGVAEAVRLSGRLGRSG